MQEKICPYYSVFGNNKKKAGNNKLTLNLFYCGTVVELLDLLPHSKEESGSIPDLGLF